MKEKIANDIKRAFEEEKMLSVNITSNLNFTFNGYKVEVEYTFSWHDKMKRKQKVFQTIVCKVFGKGCRNIGT